jgi:hypothetical protein
MVSVAVHRERMRTHGVRRIRLVRRDGALVGIVMADDRLKPVVAEWAC